MINNLLGVVVVVRKLFPTASIISSFTSDNHIFRPHGPNTVQSFHIHVFSIHSRHMHRKQTLLTRCKTIINQQLFLATMQ